MTDAALRQPDKGRALRGAQDVPPGKSRWSPEWLGPLWVWVLLMVLVVLCLLFVERFAQARTVSNILVNAVPLGLVALGLTFVILTGNIDLSVAPVISMAVTACLGILDGGDGNLLLALVIPLLAGGVVGLVNGLFTTKLHVPSFMVTLGTALIVQGVVFAYTGQATFGSSSPELTTLGFASWAGVPSLVGLFIPVYVGCLVFQNTSKTGRYFYAIGNDAASARLHGIVGGRVTIAAFTISGAMAAFAGLALATRTGGGEPLMGTGFDWDAIAAVVIGGTLIKGGRGGVAGTLVAVVILSVVNTALNLIGFSTFWQSAIKGFIVLGAILISAISAWRPVEALQRIAEARRVTE